MRAAIRHIKIHAAVLGVSLVLGACAATPPQAPNGAAGETRPATAPAAPNVADQQAALPNDPVPLPDPAELLGKSGDRLTALLGAPVFVRRDPPAEFWRYRHPDCVLELYFYEKDGAQRLDHFEMRKMPGGASSMPLCLRALMVRAQKG